MTTLYEDLGVEPTASEGEIRAAYRRKAKKSHPDAGGSAAEFSRHAHAVAILTDPARRKRYDETGSEQEKPDPESELMTMLNDLLLAVLKEIEDPATIDVVAVMKRTCAGQQQKVKDDIAAGEKALQRLDIAAKRFRSKNGDRRIDRLMRENQRRIEKPLLQQRDALDRLGRLAEMLENYSYEVDERPAPTYRPFFSHSPVWTSSGV